MNEAAKRDLRMRDLGGRVTFKTPKELEAALLELAKLRRAIHTLEFKILKSWTDWLQAMKKQQELNGYVQQSNSLSPAPGRAGGDGNRKGGGGSHPPQS